MGFGQKLEEKLKKTVLKYLEKGRPGWDIPHTLACVYWMKKLIKSEGGNPRILIPAIYLHDIGYPFKIMKFNPKKNLNLKEYHMKRGATLSKKILKSLKEFSQKEIEEISQIVKRHDDIDGLKINASKHEQLVFEADSLGQIDINRVKPTFTKSDRIKFLARFKKIRATNFKTDLGKKALKMLLEDNEKIM